jgi:hypothetical protein
MPFNCSTKFSCAHRLGSFRRSRNVPNHKQQGLTDVEIVLVIIVLAALAVAAYSIRSSMTLQTQRGSHADEPSEPLAASRDGSDAISKPSGFQSIIFPDYIDGGLLDEVAQQLGVRVDPVGLTLGAASRRSQELGIAAQGGIKAGPIAAGISSQESEGSESERSTSFSVQSSPDFRTKIRAVLRELERREELVKDLIELPDDAIPEATFLQAAVVVNFEWDLLSAEPGKSPEEDFRTEVRDHLNEVRDVARTQLQEALIRRFKRLGKELGGRLAHITSRWHVHVENGSPALGLSRLHTGALVPHAFPDRDFVAAPNHEVWIPLTTDKLLTHGQQRITDGHFVEASVLGRIDSFDPEREALVVLPIAVYSEQEPPELGDARLAASETEQRR